MKAASAPLIALLATNSFVMADLYTITTVAGAVYYFTSAEMDLVSGGHTFSSQGPKFKRGKTRVVIGIEVDTLDIEILANQDTLLGASPLLLSIHNGVLDGAKIKLEKAFMPDWNQPVTGAVYMFGGRVSTIDSLGRTGAKITVKSDLELLNVQMPRNVYLPNCTYTLFDSGCTLNKASFANAGLATGGSTKTVINCNLVQASGFFDQGTVSIGGVVRNIKSYVTGQLTLSYPLPSAPASGAALTAYAGCDKTRATCQAKFTNIVHFRGYPFVPVPETVL